ncbi:MAG: response regulator [Pararhodobacter sp.]|nr:response regulator [Pararhodobacter sp.]
MPRIKSALVVDDDPLVRGTICTALHDMGIQPLEAGDGRLAAELTGRCEFDLVVSDLFMPNMDGLELVSDVRNRLPEVKFILMTGGGGIFPLYGSEIRNLEELARLLGASLVLHKPFRPSELRAAIQSLDSVTQ